MLDVTLGIIVEDDAGVEQTIGVEQLFHSLHHGKRIVAPLVAHERCHVAARAVLSLQRAVILVYNEGLHVIHQTLISLHILSRLERLVDDEMVVALKRVTVDASIVVAVTCNEVLQVGSGFGQVFYVERHILNEAGGAQLACAANGGEHARAHGPELAILLRVIGEMYRCEGRKLLQTVFYLRDILL